MTLRTVTIAALLISTCSCGVSDQRQSSGWNYSITSTSSTIVSTDLGFSATNTSSVPSSSIASSQDGTSSNAYAGLVSSSSVSTSKTSSSSILSTDTVNPSAATARSSSSLVDAQTAVATTDQPSLNSPPETESNAVTAPTIQTSTSSGPIFSNTTENQSSVWTSIPGGGRVGSNLPLSALGHSSAKSSDAGGLQGVSSATTSVAVPVASQVATASYWLFASSGSSPSSLVAQTSSIKSVLGQANSVTTISAQTSPSSGAFNSSHIGSTNAIPSPLGISASTNETSSAKETSPILVPAHLGSAIESNATLPMSGPTFAQSGAPSPTIWPTAYPAASSGWIVNSVNASSSASSYRSSFVASGFFPSASGGHSGAVNSSITSAPSGITFSGTASPPGTASDYPPPLTSGNQTSNISICGGTVINIPNATLNWWYTTDFDFVAATISAQFDTNDSYTGWTVLDATTTFNVTSALAAPATSVTSEFNTWINSSLEYEYNYSTPPPDYVSTAVITQVATQQLNVSTGTGALPSDLIVTPAPASTVLPGPSAVASTAMTNTNFVYFSEFAVDMEKPTKARNGSNVCHTSRAIHTLPSAYAIYYDQEDPAGQTEVVGDLPAEFASELSALHLNLARIRLGTFVAEPTLLVVVEEVYGAVAVLAVTATEPAASESAVSQSLSTAPKTFSAASSVETSATVLLIPTPGPISEGLITMTPQVASSAASLMLPTPTGGKYIAPTGSALVVQTEQANPSLDLPKPTTLPRITGTVSDPVIIPFTAVVNRQPTTFLAPSNADGQITTTISGGTVVTASAVLVPNLQPTSTPTNKVDSGGIGGIFSAIQSGVDTQSASAGGSGKDNSGSGNGGSATGGGNTASGGAGTGSNGGTSGSNSGGSGSGSGSGSGVSTSDSDANTGGTGTGSGGTSGNGGTGSNGYGIPAQQSPDLSGLFSAIGEVGQSAQPGAQTTGGSGAGSSQSGASNSGSGGSGGSDSSAGSSGSNGGQSGNGASSSNNNNNNNNNDQGQSNNILLPIAVSIGDSKTTIGPSSNVVIGSQTLVPGAPAITVSGTPISLGSTAVVVGGATHTFASSPNTIGSDGGSSGSNAGSNMPGVITIGGATVSQIAVPVYAVDGTLVQPGQTVTIHNKAVYVGSNDALVIDGSTISTAALGSPTTFRAAGETVALAPTSAYVVEGGKTLMSGGSPITLDGTQYSLAPSALIIDGSKTSTLALSTTSGPLALTINSMTFTANAATEFLLSPGNVLSPGGTATISGTVVSLGPNGQVAVYNGVTQTLSPPIVTPAPPFTIAGTVYQPNMGSTYDISGQKLTPGGVITVSGTTVSLASGASAIVVNGVTRTLQALTPVAATPLTTRSPILTIGTNIITGKEGSTFVVDGYTLTPGGAITLQSGSSVTTVSLGAPGSGIVIINGVTSTIASAGVAAATLPMLTLDGHVYSAVDVDSNPAYIISGQTLTGGGVVTLNGARGVETVSLSPGGSVLVVNGVSSTLSPAATITPGPLTIDGQVYTAVSGRTPPTYVVSGQTLTEGGTIMLRGQDGTTETVSLSPDGTYFVINGKTSAILAAPTITAAPQITVDGQIITPEAGSGTSYLVSDKLLTPGGSVIFTGPNGLETVSLSPDGKTLVEVVSGAVTTSALPTAFATAQPAAPLITIGGDIFTALPGPGPSYRLPDGKTLHPGGPALTETLHGSVYIISLSASATVLVVEDVGSDGIVSRTEFETLFPATLTRGRGSTATSVSVSTAQSLTRTDSGAGGARQTGSGDASLQGSATTNIDKRLGSSLLLGALNVALFAILL